MRRLTTPTGRRVEVVTTDLLRASAEEAAAARLAVETLQVAGFKPSASMQLGEGGMRAAIRAYLERTMDPTLFPVYNRTVVVYDAGRPIAASQGWVERCDLGGTTGEVIHGNLHVLEEARDDKLSSVIFGMVILPYACQRPFSLRSRYLFVELLNPVTYYFLARRARAIYPAIVPASEPMRKAYAALTGDPQPRPKAQPVSPRVDSRTAAWLARTSDPHLRYFFELNPAYADGYGLPTLVRVSAWDMVWAVGRSAWMFLQARRQRRATPPSGRQL